MAARRKRGQAGSRRTSPQAKPAEAGNGTRGPGESAAVTPGSRVVRDRATGPAAAAQEPTGAATKAAPASGGKRLSTLAAAEQVLRKADGPLHAKEITVRILKLPGVQLAGKTPEQTVAAALAVAAKSGTRFEKTAPNTFQLKKAS